jgi:hypothetical protein
MFVFAQGFIETNQLFGDQRGLPVPPDAPSRRDIRSLLFGGKGCSFFDSTLAPEEDRQASSASFRSPRWPTGHKAR